jgi:hypothetical protein
MTRASSGLVRNPTCLGTRAALQRSGSSVQLSGRYSSRSIIARPLGLAYAKNTPSWQLSTLPAVPEYWRCTPTEVVPFFKNPVSSTTSTAPGSPRYSTT